MRYLISLSIVAASTFAAGCQQTTLSGPDPAAGATSSNLTVGKVQSEIKKGMTGGQVAEVLGSPNIVTTDPDGTEVWIYDRAATEVRYADSSGGVWLILGAIGGSSGETRKSQSTLTVIVKFDAEHHVRDLAYHSSRF